jgi:hypothetical protein
MIIVIKEILAAARSVQPQFRVWVKQTVLSNLAELSRAKIIIVVDDR